MAQFSNETITIYGSGFTLDAIIGTGTVMVDGFTIIPSATRDLIFNKAQLHNCSVVIPATAIVIGDHN